MATRSSSGRRRKWLRRGLAWSVTIGVVAFLLIRYSPQRIGEAVAHGNWLGMIPFAAFAALWSLFCMATADWIVFRAALGRSRYGDVIRGRAGVSVMQAFNHSVGQATYAVWIGRKSGSDVRTTLGLIGYVVTSDLTALFAVATGAVWLSGIRAADLAGVELMAWIGPLVTIGLVAAAFLGPRILPRLVPRAKLLKPWTAVPPAHYVANVVFRSASLIGIMVAVWGAARAFGLDIPLAAILTYLPVIFLAGALPINVFGFGAVQLVWVEAFEPWVPGEEVIAFQLLYHLMLVAGFVIRGAPFFSGVVDEIERGNQELDEELAAES